MISLAEKQRTILKAILEGKTQRQIVREMKISRTKGLFSFNLLITFFRL